MVIDSSLFIEYLRAKDKSSCTLMNLPLFMGGNLYVSTVTIFEIYSGCLTLSHKHDADLILDGILRIDFSDEIAKKASEIFINLRQTGQTIEFRDIFIAATALVHNLPLKTLNTKHFSRINGLILA